MARTPARQIQFEIPPTLLARTGRVRALWNLASMISHGVLLLRFLWPPGLCVHPCTFYVCALSWCPSALISLPTRHFLSPFSPFHLFTFRLCVCVCFVCFTFSSLHLFTLHLCVFCLQGETVKKVNARKANK